MFFPFKFNWYWYALGLAFVIFVLTYFIDFDSEEFNVEQFKLQDFIKHMI